jgi:predicted cupin superfamily sugar epimerase
MNKFSPTMADSTKERIAYLVDTLNLEPHPEGGYFKEHYRSNHFIRQRDIEGEFSGDRNYCTSIYFLLTSNNFSAFHRIKQDEIWHFYEGNALTIHVIDEEGVYKAHSLGLELNKGQRPQFVVPANLWFGSSVETEDSYALVGCTVAPGFDFNDFELASRTELINSYPAYQEIITKLTRI